MKNIWMKTAATAGLALMLMSGTALAGNAAPRTDVVIEGDQITLGDVFSGVTQNADRVLAPAPSPGRPLTLDVRDLQRISNAFHLDWKPLANDEKTVITSASTVIAAEQVKRALADALAERFPERAFEISLPASSYPLTLVGKFSGRVEVTDLAYDPARGFFDAGILVPSAGQKKDFTAKVSGRIARLVEVPVLSDNIRAGSVIGKGDVTYVTMRDGDIGQNILLDAQQLVGQTPRRGIGALKPLQASDLQAPSLVEKGELVTVFLKKGKLSLSVKGRALENGADGATIRVLNPTSNKVVDATVTGPQSVTIVM